MRPRPSLSLLRIATSGFHLSEPLFKATSGTRWEEHQPRLLDPAARTKAVASKEGKKEKKGQKREKHQPRLLEDILRCKAKREKKHKKWEDHQPRLLDPVANTDKINCNLIVVDLRLTGWDGTDTGVTTAEKIV